MPHQRPASAPRKPSGSLSWAPHVREYWIVDPMREVTVVYKREEEGFPVIYKFGESVKAGIYEELEITIK